MTKKLAVIQTENIEKLQNSRNYDQTKLQFNKQSRTLLERFLYFKKSFDNEITFKILNYCIIRFSLENKKDDFIKKAYKYFAMHSFKIKTLNDNLDNNLSDSSNNQDSYSDITKLKKFIWENWNEFKINQCKKTLLSLFLKIK